jgi:hypothetical protein
MCDIHDLLIQHLKINREPLNTRPFQFKIYIHYTIWGYGA